LGKTAAETVTMLKEAYKDEAMGKTQVYKWFNHLKRGEMSVEDHPHSGRPSRSRSDENVGKVCQAVFEDRRWNTDEISEITGLSWSSCQRIIMEALMMKLVAARFMPRLLTEEQKNKRVNVCCDLQEELKNDPQFLIKVVTGDENWCYSYDPESKQQSSQWKSPNSPRPKKAGQVRSSVKTMLISFFDTDGTVNKEFVPQRQTVN
jgi:histone-lysine N-methyltransferase SETMAR